MTALPPIRLVLLLVFAFVFPGLADAATPKWKLIVPTSTLASTSSNLGGVTSSAAGDAFVVISHWANIDMGGIPLPTQIGVQLLLLNPSGKVVGSGEFAGTFVNSVLYVSAKRVLALTSAGVTEFSVGPGATLVSKPVPLETMTELAVPSAPALGSKFLHTSVISGGFVSEVRRYLFSKLKP